MNSVEFCRLISLHSSKMVRFYLTQRINETESFVFNVPNNSISTIGSSSKCSITLSEDDFTATIVVCIRRFSQNNIEGLIVLNCASDGEVAVRGFGDDHRPLRAGEELLVFHGESITFPNGAYFQVLKEIENDGNGEDVNPSLGERILIDCHSCRFRVSQWERRSNVVQQSANEQSELLQIKKNIFPVIFYIHSIQ